MLEKRENSLNVKKVKVKVIFANQNMLLNSGQVASLPAETLAWVDSQRKERKRLLEGLPGCMQRLVENEYTNTQLQKIHKGQESFARAGQLQACRDQQMEEQDPALSLLDESENLWRCAITAAPNPTIFCPDLGKVPKNDRPHATRPKPLVEHQFVKHCCTKYCKALFCTAIFCKSQNIVKHQWGADFVGGSFAR